VDLVVTGRGTVLRVVSVNQRGKRAPERELGAPARRTGKLAANNTSRLKEQRDIS